MEYSEANKAPSTVQELEAQSKDRMAVARAAVEDYLGRVSDRAREAAAYTDRRVQDNPWTAVGIGFGLGMIFGALIAMAARSQAGALERLR